MKLHSVDYKDWFINQKRIPDKESEEYRTFFNFHKELCMNGCYVNGELLSKGNAKDMNWSFAEIIERASYGVELFPGDVIGSGTVGTGCLLELNGTGKRDNPEYQERWIQENDEVEMQIEGLGKITNKIVKANSDHSILKLKK